ncbi:MAG: DUF177 domain-containing protein [Acidobacteriota bacterium]|nr:DUF177 domain-containing protein [Acidobacteriota bacterium]
MTTATSARPFLVHAARLRRSVGSRQHEVRRGAIEDLACSGSRVPEGSEVEADVVLESVMGGLSVAGTVRAPWVGTCRRCLEPAGGVLELPVREHFTEEGDGEETYRLDDGEADLEPMVRDAVLLELPQAPLCRPDCQGLCPTCGANRNLEACDCAPVRDDRWAALDALRVPDAAGPGYPGQAPDHPEVLPSHGRPQEEDLQGEGP